jgi:hypothetical protein
LKGLLGFYLDTVDTSAFNNAVSGRADQWEAPVLPLVAPWIIAGPILYFMRGQQQAWFYLFTGAMILSIGAYALMMVYYYRAKRRHRESLGLPDWRAKIRQKVADDMAKLD